MSDFEAFVSESDPAAEFLAREQNALADIEEDFDFPPNSKDLSQSIPLFNCF